MLLQASWGCSENALQTLWSRYLEMKRPWRILKRYPRLALRTGLPFGTGWRGDLSWTNRTDWSVRCSIVRAGQRFVKCWRLSSSTCDRYKVQVVEDLRSTSALPAETGGEHESFCAHKRVRVSHILLQNPF